MCIMTTSLPRSLQSRAFCNAQIIYYVFLTISVKLAHQHNIFKSPDWGYK